jgi:hypothetical protein
MLRSLAGHPTTFIKGREYDLPTQQAHRYIELGLASPVGKAQEIQHSASMQTETKVQPKRSTRKK